MKNFKIYAVSNEDNSKYEISLKHYNRDNGLYECQWVY